MDGFAVPLTGCGDVSIAKFDEAHGFVGEGVVGIVAKHFGEKSFGVFAASVVDEEVCADGVGFRRDDVSLP